MKLHGITLAALLLLCHSALADSTAPAPQPAAPTPASAPSAAAAANTPANTAANTGNNPSTPSQTMSSSPNTAAPSAADWDKTFPADPRVEHSKISFRTRFGNTIVADLYRPKGAAAPLPAIAVSGPFGAVKEQCSGLYAQSMAARGYLCIAFDPSFTGESSGEPRNVASPDINTEDFCAAVDYLSTHQDVDPERIAIIGICGWGGMAINAAAVDTRIKATVASTMYDMCRVTARGYFDADDSPEARQRLREKLSAQRTLDYRNGSPQRAGGVIDPLPADAPAFVRDYYDYYKTPRGYHPRSLNSNAGWNTTSAISLLNGTLLAYADEIRSAVLIVHGEKAHSRYFGEDAFRKLKGDNKKLIIVPGAVHTDLYDRLIPFDSIDSFLKQNMPVGEKNKA